MIQRPPRSTLFPYTTRFRSHTHTHTHTHRLLPNEQNRLESIRSEEHTSELQSLLNLVCRLLLENKKRASLECFATEPHPCASHVDTSTRTRARASMTSYRLSGRVVVLQIECMSQSYFFNNTGTTEIYTLSLREAFPI